MRNSDGVNSPAQSGGHGAAQIETLPILLILLGR